MLVMHTYGCFSKQCTSEMSRTLQSSTVCFSRVSYLLECNADDTYVLRMTHIDSTLLGLEQRFFHDVPQDGTKKKHEWLSDVPSISYGSKPLRCLK